MKMKRWGAKTPSTLKCTAALVILAAALVFAGCGGGGDDGPSGAPEFTVSIVQPTGGTISASPMRGPAGTEISVYVNAAQGNKYKTGSLKRSGTVIDDSGSQPYTFTLTGNVTLTAEFEQLPSDEYSVTIGSLTNGTITAEPAYGRVGTTITLTVSPKQGFVLKEDSLTYTAVNGSPVAINESTYEFTLPAAHVTVNAVFEQGNLDSFLEQGIRALEAGNYDTAISLFESAYGLAPTDPAAIVYSTLGRLAAIAVDNNVKTLMTNRLGFTGYPGTINKLVSPDWMETYTDEWLQWYYYDNSGTWGYWMDDWDVNYYGLAHTGYYTYQYLSQSRLTLISSTRKTGRFDSYYDEGLGEWVYWEDYTPSPGQGWSPDPPPGYTVPGYYYGGFPYALVTSTPKKAENYWDADLGTNLWWLDDTRTDEVGYSVPGYYYWDYETQQYVFETSTEKVETGYYDGDSGHYVYWKDLTDVQNKPSWYSAPGYYYENNASSYQYFLVTSVQKTGALDSYSDPETGRYYYWRDSDPGSSYTGYTGVGYYWEQSGEYILVSETPQYRTETQRSPGLATPSWIANTDWYKGTLTHDLLKSSATFDLLLYTNLIDKNTTGLNTLLDQVLSGAFGTAFEAAYTRGSALTAAQNVELTTKTLEAFGISDIFEGEKVYIGKAELNMLFAALRFVKASVEWVAAYNWDTDLNFLKNGSLWDDWSKLGQSANKPANLPLRNNFLKDRGNGMMAKSKEDFSKAIDDAIAAYDLWIGSSSKLPAGYKDTLQNEYAWAKDGFNKLKTAINGGSTFYVKDDASGSTYNNTASGALIGIKMDKFFNPGQLALSGLIENTGSGNSIKPKFYSYNEGTNSLVEITTKADLSNYGLIGFKFKLEPFKEIFALGFEDLPNEEVVPIFTPEIAGHVWDWYN